MRKLCTVLAALLLLSTCGEPGDLPFVVKPITPKGRYYTNTAGKEDWRTIEAACYIDPARYNPLNAGDYTMKKSGLPFFDYVILGGASLRRDARGPYLAWSDDLQKLLARRAEWITPLQKKGIRILLSVASSSDMSLGNLTEDQARGFATVLYEALRFHGLDGLELDDEMVNPANYPCIEDYDAGKDTENLGPEQWLLEQWKRGGDNISNLAYLFYILTFRAGTNTEPGYKMPLVLLEKNYAGYLPVIVSCTEGYADFAGSTTALSYVVNCDYEEFAPPGNLYTTTSGTAAMPDDMFGPLAVDLEGRPGRNIWYLSNGEELPTLFGRFCNDHSEIVYFHNLTAVSEAENEYFAYPWFDPGRPETPFLDEHENWGSNPRFFPVWYIINEFATSVFNEPVECAGGNYRKAW
jgi:hypothetical protein